MKAAYAAGFSSRAQVNVDRETGKLAEIKTIGHDSISKETSNPAGRVRTLNEAHISNVVQHPMYCK
jgi:hypothetical protein